MGQSSWTRELLELGLHSALPCAQAIHYSGNVLILGLYPTCMHNTFQ
jgi:hypothetical protein